MHLYTLWLQFYIEIHDWVHDCDSYFKLLHFVWESCTRNPCPSPPCSPGQRARGSVGPVQPITWSSLTHWMRLQLWVELSNVMIIVFVIGRLATRQHRRVIFGTLYWFSLAWGNILVVVFNATKAWEKDDNNSAVRINDNVLTKSYTLIVNTLSVWCDDTELWLYRIYLSIFLSCIPRWHRPRGV